MNPKLVLEEETDDCYTEPSEHRDLMFVQRIHVNTAFDKLGSLLTRLLEALGLALLVGTLFLLSGCGDGDSTDPGVAQEFLGVLDFDIAVNDKWKFSASERSSGEIILVPPFTVSFQPKGQLLDHLDEWSLEVGGKELGWGDTLVIGSDMSDRLGIRFIGLVNRRTGEQRTGYPWFHLVERGAMLRNADTPFPIPRVEKMDADGLAGMAAEGDPSSGFEVSLSSWTAYENEKGERSGFDATFTVTHPAMDPECQFDVLGLDGSDGSRLETFVLGSSQLGEFAARLGMFPSFDGPGYVHMITERQWWADWTRGDEESRFDISVRVLPVSLESETVRRDHFDRTYGSLPNRAYTYESMGKWNRDRPVTHMDLTFQINCGTHGYQVSSSFSVPINDIKRLEQLEPGAPLIRPE